MAGHSGFLMHGLFLHVHTHLQFKEQFGEKLWVFLKERKIKPAVRKQIAIPGTEQNLTNIIQQGNNVFREGIGQFICEGERDRGVTHLPLVPNKTDF